MRSNRMIAAALVVGLAGLPAAAFAQSGTLPSHTDAKTDHRTTDGRRFDLTPCERLNSASVVNRSGESVGSVQDLIVSRSTGEIMYVVLKSGAILGIGGKAVAVPFGSFQWDDAKDRFSLNMSPDQVQALPEFSAESWANLHQPESGLRTWLNRQFDEHDRRDAGAEPVRTADAKPLRGEVVAVERSTYGPHGEDVIIVVRTDSGEQQRVLLGPSWYVMGVAAAPMRSDKVHLTVVEFDGPADRVALKGDINGVATTYRGADGRPVWIGDTTESRAWRERGPSARLVLISDIDGADVQCRGESCGAVDEVIVDHRSGRALMLSIDPDENILGIGDDNRLVPWSIAYLGVDGVVNIDADKRMITTSVQTPDTFDGFRDYETVQRVYTAFGVRMPGATDPARPQPSDPMRTPSSSKDRSN